MFSQSVIMLMLNVYMIKLNNNSHHYDEVVMQESKYSEDFM